MKNMITFGDFLSLQVIIFFIFSLDRLFSLNGGYAGEHSGLFTLNGGYAREHLAFNGFKQGTATS